MNDVVVFDGFSLRPQGPTLTLNLGTGQTLLVLGRAASGKSRFLKSILGQERGRQGSVSCSASISIAGMAALSKRSTPQQIASRFAGKRNSATVASALQALHLRDVSDEPVADMSPSQRAALELLPVLCTDAGVAVIDGQLDLLDPWTRASALEALLAKASRGTTLIAASNRAELANLFDSLVVLKDGIVRFAGDLGELLRTSGPSAVTVESTLQPGVRALADPFTVRVRETPDGTVFYAEEGQQLAARLLLEGYGDVKFVMLSEPTPEQAILSL